MVSHSSPYKLQTINQFTRDNSPRRKGCPLNPPATTSIHCRFAAIVSELGGLEANHRRPRDAMLEIDSAIVVAHQRHSQSFANVDSADSEPVVDDSDDSRTLPL